MRPPYVAEFATVGERTIKRLAAVGEELTPTQNMLLFAIAVKPGELSTGDLAALIERDRAEVSRALGVLEAQKRWIISITDPNDRRSKRFWITPSGVQIARKAVHRLTGMDTSEFEVRTKSHD